jgi:phage portal protein BeeE
MSTYLRSRYPAPIDTTGTVASAAWAEILGLTQPDTITVNDTSVRGLPALNRAKAMVVNSVSAMLVNSNVANLGQPVDKPLVVARPHPALRPTEFYRSIVDSLIVRGNYVAIVVGEDPDEDMQLVPVPLGAVSVDGTSGLPVYTIGQRAYSWREIFHVRHNAPTGEWWGRGILDDYCKSLSEHLHSQAYGESRLRSGAVPSMLVQLDQETPTQDQVTAAKSGLMTTLGNGKSEPLVHGKGMSITPVGWTPHEAEFVEARKTSFAEAALMVGLRPEDIGTTLGDSMTYGNRQDDALQRITDGYGPWMALIEEGFSDLVRCEVKGNPETLLRMSTKERLEIRKLAQEIGVETPEESRAEEGRTPLQIKTSDPIEAPDTEEDPS